MDPIWGNLFRRKEKDEDRFLSVLSKTNLFEGLSKNDLRQIIRIIHKREFKKDEVIFKYGDPGVGMYIVMDGEVSVYVQDEHTNEKTEVASFRTNQSFGDIALFSEIPRSATVISKEPSVLLGFCKPDLLGLIHRNPKLGAEILKRLLGIAGKRLEHTNNLLAEVRHDNRLLREKESEPEASV
jgi:CRP-like cAMP-binding protein